MVLSLLSWIVLFLAALQVCANGATSAVQVTDTTIQPAWGDSFSEAERLARDVSFQDHRASWSGDSARALLLNLLAESPLGDSAGYLIHLALGDYFFRDLKITEAEMHWRKADSIGVRLWPTTAIERRNLAWRFAVVARENGEYWLADSLEQVALADTSVDAERLNRYVYLRELAKIQIRLLRIEDAWKVHEQIVREWRKRPVGDPQAVVVALMDLAEGASKLTFTNFQNERTAQDSAILLGQEALAIARTYVATDSPIAGYVLNRLGDYYRRRGQDQLAEQCWQEALDINLATRSEDDIETQGSISRIGNVLLQQGNYARAERLLTRAVELRKKTQGEAHQEVAAMISNLAALCRQTGKFARAESLLTVALAIRRKALPEDHPDIAANLSALGRVCFEQGRLSVAETYWRDAQGRLESVLGGNNAATVTVLQNLANLYVEWGREEDALRMLKEVVTVRKKFLGEDHPAVITGNLELAELQLQLNQLKAAEKTLRETRRLADARGKKPPLEVLLAEASLHSKHRQYPESDSLIETVISKRAAAFGGNSMLLIDPLRRLATNKQAERELVIADSLLGRLMQIAAENEMISTPAAAGAMLLRGDIQLALNKVKDADSLYRQSFQISLSSFYDGIAVMPEQLAVAYSRKLRTIRDRCLTMLIDSSGSKRPDRPGRRAKTITSADRKRHLSELAGTKSAILDVAFRRHSQMHASIDSGTMMIIDSLNDVDLRLSRLYLTAARDSSAVGLDRQIRQLADAKRVLEDQLTHAASSVAGVKSTTPFSFDTLVTVLGDNKASIDYVRFDFGSPVSGAIVPCYLATITTRGRVYVHQLGPAAPIDSLLARLQGHLASLAQNSGHTRPSASLEYLAIAQQLKDLIWSPFETFLPDSGQIFVAPDALLHLVSFAALPEGATRFLVERYEFTYVNAVRDILSLPFTHVVQGNLLAVGDPAFERRPRPVQVSEKATKLAAVGAVTSLATRALAPRCPIATQLLSPLPASSFEVGTVVDYWSHRAGCLATALLNDEASEENFKRLAPDNVAVHVATHAFRWDSNCLSGVSRAVAQEYPQLLSGLMLAGAAAPVPDSEVGNTEDGVLTAEEIAQMNLRNTSVVVLSACESGLGEISTGEGVIGLRRAFQLAGAKSVISALWEIPDQSTARLMRQVYQGMERGFSMALRNAQLQALQAQREARVPIHPYSWGAFIAYGN